MTNPDRYAVFGHPITHSKSPRIHQLFALQTQQNLTYSAEDVPPQQFEAKLLSFLENGGKGLNCTVPLKELAYRLNIEKSDKAIRAKAVNTLSINGQGQLFGDNTDGVGLLTDLTRNLEIKLSGLKILILGAGGATRGILAPLLETKPVKILIANRTEEKAHVLANEFAELGAVAGCGLDSINEGNFNLIFNATPTSLNRELPKLPPWLLAQGGVCYDLAYAQQPTPFVLWGNQQGASLSVDGIGMLVEQAAEAFQLWRGVRPLTQPILEILNSERTRFC